MPLFVRTTGHYDKKKEISCHDCFRENSLQRPAAALTRRITYSCDRRTTDGMELLFIRIFAVKGGFESGEALVATVIENKLMVSTLKDE